MKHAQMTSKWLSSCFTTHQRYTTKAEFLLLDEPFRPMSYFKNFLEISGKNRSRSAPHGYRHQYLSLINLEKTLSLNLAAIPVLNDPFILQNSRHLDYYLHKDNNDVNVEFLELNADPPETAILDASSIKPPRLPFQHEKVLNMLDNYDNNVTLISKMERLRHYFPITLTTMTTETTESLLFSAKASNSISINSGTTSSFLRSISSAATSSSQTTSAAILAAAQDMGFAHTRSVALQTSTNITVGCSDPAQSATIYKQSHSFSSIEKTHYSNSDSQLQSQQRDDAMKLSTSDNTFNANEISFFSSFFTGTPTSARLPMYTLVHYVIGTEQLDILPEYSHNSSHRTELLRRPGRHVLSHLSDKVYMGDPYRLSVLRLTPSERLNTFQLLTQSNCLPETNFFPMYWIGTPAYYMAPRITVNVNGNLFILIANTSLSVFDRASPSFDPFCVFRFNRISNLISNTARYTCILNLKPRSASCNTNNSQDYPLKETTRNIAFSHIAECISLQVFRAARIECSHYSQASFDRDPSLQFQPDANLILSNNTSLWSSMQRIQDKFIENSTGSSSHEIKGYLSQLVLKDQSNTSSLLNLSDITTDVTNNKCNDLECSTDHTKTSAIDNGFTDSNKSNKSRLSNLSNLFRQPLRATECLRKDFDRRSHHLESACHFRQPENPVSMQNNSTQKLIYRYNNIAKVIDPEKYVKKRKSMIESAYAMGLRLKNK